MKPRTFNQHLLDWNSGDELHAKMIVLHETADPGATAAEERAFFNKIRNKCAHAFIDWTQDLQILPWNTQGWHARSPANEMAIGVEMCRPETHDPEKMKIVYWSTVDAFARLYRYILGIRTVTPENLMTHHEVTLKWKRSTHTDPTSLFKEYGYTIEQFRKDVQYRLDRKW